MISMIWAEGLDGTIGVDNTIPWHIPEDFKYFKNMTLNSTVVMGRKTWESLPTKPLPGRFNVVLTKDDSYTVPGAETLSDAQEIVRRGKDDDQNIWIIGGGKIYEYFMPYADRIRVTKVGYENTHPHSTKSPQIDENIFAVKSSSHKFMSSKGLTYQFIEYERIS